jgi:hypothetical protein
MKQFFLFSLKLTTNAQIYCILVWCTETIDLLISFSKFLANPIQILKSPEANRMGQTSN